MKRDLIYKSKQGLALARLLPSEGQPSLELRFFDDHKESRRPECCPHAGERSISRNRILIADMDYSVGPDSDLQQLSALALRGGQVVVLNAQGTVINRSEVSVRTGLLSLSPDEKQFAFIGAPSGEIEAGVYVAGFRDKQARKLSTLAPVKQYKVGEVVHNVLTHPTVDWSPKSDHLLLSDGGSVLLLDAQTGQSRKIADGGGGQWSPSGNLITYITTRSEAALLHLATGESRLIDPGKEVLRPVEWSPDGQYVLIAEGKGSHVAYGCLWVYRVSDGAFVPIQYYGMTNPAPHWIQLGK